jgi:hypothetical protein
MRVFLCGRRANDCAFSCGACDHARRMAAQRGARSVGACPAWSGPDRMSRSGVGAFDPWRARERSVRGHGGLAGASPPRSGATRQFAPSHVSAWPLRYGHTDGATSPDSTHDRLALWRGDRAYAGNHVSRVRPLGCRARRARAAPAGGRRPHGPTRRLDGARAALAQSQANGRPSARGALPRQLRNRLVCDDSRRSRQLQGRQLHARLPDA